MDTNKKRNVTPFEHITAIAKEFERESSKLLKTFFNLSNCVIETALNGSNKFLYEILQNADDSHTAEKQSIEIEFIIKDDYLIIRYNGRSFDFDDVERICDYASSIDVKGSDPDKTGYKGLGFKTLFNISDCITIVSSGYSFRFDKHHRGGDKMWPWQIVPIWCKTNDLPYRGQLCTQSVNFILKMNNSYDITRQLTNLKQKPEALLFLNHINKLIINSDVIEKCITPHHYPSLTKVDFYNNRKLMSTWLLATYEKCIPHEIKVAIEDGSQFSYPEKVKNAEKVTCNFAIRFNTSSVEIFQICGLCHATLPTEVSLQLPYHINGPFLLNLDRTQLSDNKWNSYLIKCFGSLQLYLLKDLASISDLKNFVVILFRPKISHNLWDFRTSFERGLNDVKDIAWIPSYQSESDLLKLGEVWVDSINFFSKFHLIKDLIVSKLIAYEVKSKTNLCDYRLAKNFDLCYLLGKFSQYFSEYGNEFYFKFITYLYGNFYYSISQLEYSRILLTEGKTLVAPKEACLEIASQSVPSFLGIDPVDKKLLPKTKEIKQWLLCLGVKELSALQVVRKIINWIQGNKITVQIHMDIIDYLTETFNDFWLYLNYEEKAGLKKVCILTRDQKFRSAHECYWPDEKFSLDNLKNILCDNDLVSSNYPVKAKELLLLIGVHGQLTFQTLYIKYLKCLHLSDPYYAKYFWENFIEYYKKYKPSENYDQLFKTVIEYLRQNKCLRGNNEKLYYSSELYASSFKEISDIDYETFPLLNCSSKLPKKLEKAIGFITTLKRDKIVKLFKSIKVFPEKASLSVFKLILKHLEENNNNVVGEESAVLWAESNTLQPAKTLYYFIEEKAEFPRKCPAYLKRLPGMEHEEMIRLAKLCGVHIIPYSVQLSAKNLAPDNTLTELWLDILPLVALQEAYCLNKDNISVLHDLYEILQGIHLYRCSELNIKYEFQDNALDISYFFEAENSNFFVVSSWNKANCKIKVTDQFIKLLHLKTDCREILAFEDTEDVKHWLFEQQFDMKTLDMLVEEIETFKVSNPISIPESQIEIAKLITFTEKIQDISADDIEMNNEPSSVSDVSKNATIQMPTYYKSEVHDNISKHSKVVQKKQDKYHNDSMINDRECMLSLVVGDEDITLLGTQIHRIDVGNLTCLDQFEEPINDITYFETLRITDTFECSRHTNKDINNFTIETTSLSSRRMTVSQFVKEYAGIHGEKIVFAALKRQYTQMYSTVQTEESGDKFIIRNVAEPETKLDIIWLNKNEESGKPYDFLLYENDDLKLVIEVKSTSTNDKRIFELSHSEFLVMQKYKEKYNIYRVFNADSVDPLNVRIEILENPANLLEQGLLKLTPKQYTLEYQANNFSSLLN